MKNNNSVKLDSNLTATEKFAIDSMVQKVNEDWEIFAETAQKEIDIEYNRIGNQGKAKSDTAFIQQRIERIETVKRSVEEARRTRNIRLSDLEKVELMLGSKK